MGSQGRQLSAEVEEIVVRLKKHHDEELKSGKFVSTKNPAGRTAACLGIGVATVKRIMARYVQSGDKVIARSIPKPGRPPSKIFKNVQPIVRQFIRTENLSGRDVSLNRVGKFLLSEHNYNIPKTNLWRALNRWGFTHGEGRRRDSLKEKDHVILARRKYLREKIANREIDGTLKRPEVYLDETYVNKNHSSRFTWYLEGDGPWVNKPSGVGPRLIVVHAITKDGWVKGAELVFDSKRRTGDYHGQMNWGNFSKWFQTQLIPNIPVNSIVILDNAKYHNVLDFDNCLGRGSTKEQLRSWLTHNKIPLCENILKAELLELYSLLAPAPQFRLDQLAAKKGISILRTPQYHPELQPIETCWAVVKNDIARNCDFKMKGLRDRVPEAFAKVTPDTCQRIIAKVVEQENKYWIEDEKLDEKFAENSEENFASRKAFEVEGLEHHFEEM
ncbi:MAG: hypothetical protein GY860_27640 [Desulfobacteraceae bacterium]|nr:hypothetical protein [Desulfobacteraceae bacterium]